jgi:glycerophosphoryl diester phosphodiesterase
MLFGGILSYSWPAIVHRPLLLFAHHGDLSKWPENSIEGLLGAVALQVDGVEMDIQKSADGTWWLMHDDRVEATTDGSGMIAELRDETLATLTIDGGHGFDSSRHHGLKLARLTDALNDLGGRTGLIVDIKSHDLGDYTAIARELIDRGLDDTYVICQSVSGATAVKSVDTRLRTIYGAPITWHKDVDLYLAYAKNGIDWPQVPFSDFFGDAAMFVDRDFTENQGPILERAERWGIAIALVNDAAAAVAWRKAQAER